MATERARAMGAPGNSCFKEDRNEDNQGRSRKRRKRPAVYRTGRRGGGDDGTRTHDLLSAIQALFQTELHPHPGKTTFYLKSGTERNPFRSRRAEIQRNLRVPELSYISGNACRAHALPATVVRNGARIALPASREGDRRPELRVRKPRLTVHSLKDRREESPNTTGQRAS
jgi:hypothetical protein